MTYFTEARIREAAQEELDTLRQQRDDLLAALEGTIYVFADKAEATRPLVKHELEQLAFARAAIARATG